MTTDKNGFVYVYEDDLFKLRDDLASDVVVEEGVQRYSLFYKPDYHRVVVFRSQLETALADLASNYDKFRQEAEEFSRS